MSSMVAQPQLPTPLLVAEKRSKQAKAALKGVRKAENVGLWVKWGAAIKDVQHEFQLSLKEFAAALGNKDERQVQRWMDAQERPQIETVLAVPDFEGPMWIALARRISGITVDTVYHVRRSA